MKSSRGKQLEVEWETKSVLLIEMSRIELNWVESRVVLSLLLLLLLFWVSHPDSFGQFQTTAVAMAVAVAPPTSKLTHSIRYNTSYFSIGLLD